MALVAAARGPAVAESDADAAADAVDPAAAAEPSRTQRLRRCRTAAQSAARARGWRRAGDADAAEAAERPAELSAYEDTVDHGDRIQSADAIANGYDTEVENVFPEQRGAGPARATGLQWSEHGGRRRGAPDIDQFVAARPTLSDHLNEQIGLLLTDPAERLIARFLTDGLNEAGYLARRTRSDRRPARRPARDRRGGAAQDSRARSGGGLCPRRARVPGHPAARARPARSDDAAAARQSAI